MSNLNRPHFLSSILLIAVAPVILFWRWIFFGEVLYWGTPLFQFWPWHQLVKTITLSGEWPLWNPYLGNGTPLLANLQSAVFYPPNLIYLILPVPHAFTLSVILHIALAGLLMYAYPRYIGVSRFGATVAALTYMFSGYLMGRLQFITMVNAYAWLPLLLLLAERLVTHRKIQDVIWLSFILAVQILAGHAQLWFYSLCLISGYILFRGWQTAQEQQIPIIKLWWQVGLRFSGAIFLTILLAAAQLIPTAEFTTLSPRGSGAESYFALTYSFWPWRFITLLFPDFFGHPAQGDYWGYANYWEDHAYLGILPLMFAVITIIHTIRSYFSAPSISQKGKQNHSTAFEFPPAGGLRGASSVQHHIALFFIVLLPISLIFALGWNTPVYLWVFEYVPGFGYFQAPSRLLIWYTIGIAILAGFGADYIRSRPINLTIWSRLLVVCLGLTIAGIAGNIILSGVNATFIQALIKGGILLTVSTLILLAHTWIHETKLPSQSQRARWQATWPVVVVLFIVIDLFSAAAPLIRTLPTSAFARNESTNAYIEQTDINTHRIFVNPEFDYQTKFDQYFRFDQFGPETTQHWQKLQSTLVPNLGLSENILSANNDDPLVVGHWQQMIDQVENAAPTQQEQLLSLMNVGYVIDTKERLNGAAIFQNDQLAVQQLPQPLPRAYFVTSAIFAETEAEALSILINSDFDYTQKVVIMDEVAELEAKGETRSILPANIIEDTPNRVTLAVEAPSEGYVILTDTFYPGWQAFIEAQPVEIHQANLMFRAVQIKPGAQTITFQYRPQSFFTGLWISGITFLGLIIFSFLRYRTINSKS